MTQLHDAIKLIDDALSISNPEQVLIKYYQTGNADSKEVMVTALIAALVREHRRRKSLTAN